MDAPEQDNYQVTDIGDLVPISASMAVSMHMGEIDQQVTTAKRYPRSLKEVRNDVTSLVTLDARTAAECTYALPRGGKPITGPSIRFAEIVFSQYGNCRASAMVINIDRENKILTAEGVFHDLEKNAATRKTVQRRISNKTGALLTDDMIIVTGNAACSIALRNAILGGVPRALYWQAYEAALKTVKGDIKTLAERRANAIKAFAIYGVKPDQIYAALDIKGVDDIDLDALMIIGGMANALASGEATVEDMFPVKKTELTATERLKAAKETSGPQSGGFDENHVRATTGAKPAAKPHANAQTGKDAPPLQHKGEPTKATPALQEEPEEAIDEEEEVFERDTETGELALDLPAVETRTDDAPAVEEFVFDPETAQGKYWLRICKPTNWAEFRKLMMVIRQEKDWKLLEELEGHTELFAGIQTLPIWQLADMGDPLYTSIKGGF